MRIALAQINTKLADFKGNLQKMLDLCLKASQQGAEVIVFPELAVSGYPPLDLLDQKHFVESELKAIGSFKKNVPANLAVIFGYLDLNPSPTGKPFINTVAVIQNQEICFTQAKTLLPTYDVFDEARYFEPAVKRKAFCLKGKKIGIAICEDLWWEKEYNQALQYPIEPVRDLVKEGIEILFAPSASPFFLNKPFLRKRLLQQISQQQKIAICYVNMVGGNDGLIFDGQSMYFSPDGRLQAVGLAFAEDLVLVDSSAPVPALEFKPDELEQLTEALVLGIKDYIFKCGFSRVHVGLSGGIDSALVAVLATLSLGKANVKAFGLPSRYSSAGSIADARELAYRLGISYEVIPIEDIYRAFLNTLTSPLQLQELETTQENIQARIRGSILMAYANRYQSVLLNTGNKSELATGYCTLYGDMCGSLAVIGDLFKTQVYALARHINQRYGFIPETILSKAPTAELKPNQTDQDTLPPYELLDAILKDYLLDNLSFPELVAKGYPFAVVKQVLTMVARAEYKRRQAPPVLKVSPRAFGMGRRMPIARELFELKD